MTTQGYGQIGGAVLSACALIALGPWVWCPRVAGAGEVADEAPCEAFARLYAYRDGVRDPVAWVFRTAFGLASRELTRQVTALDYGAIVGQL